MRSNGPAHLRRRASAPTAPNRAPTPYLKCERTLETPLTMNRTRMPHSIAPRAIRRGRNVNMIRAVPSGAAGCYTARRRSDRAHPPVRERVIARVTRSGARLIPPHRPREPRPTNCRPRRPQPRAPPVEEYRPFEADAAVPRNSQTVDGARSCPNNRPRPAQRPGEGSMPGRTKTRRVLLLCLYNARGSPAAAAHRPFIPARWPRCRRRVQPLLDVEHRRHELSPLVQRVALMEDILQKLSPFQGDRDTGCGVHDQRLRAQKPKPLFEGV